jgi:hypothetical protein
VTKTWNGSCSSCGQHLPPLGQTHSCTDWRDSDLGRARVALFTALTFTTTVVFLAAALAYHGIWG